MEKAGLTSVYNFSQEIKSEDVLCLKKLKIRLLSEYKNWNKHQPFKMKSSPRWKGTHQTFRTLIDVQQKGKLSSIFPEQCFGSIVYEAFLVQLKPERHVIFIFFTTWGKKNLEKQAKKYTHLIYILT